MLPLLLLLLLVLVFSLLREGCLQLAGRVACARAGPVFLYLPPSN